MPDISIENETEYALTPAICEQIRRDALEYFGESVRLIRVQYGIERHAFNARTGEMRFAFSPSDFGVVDTASAVPETYYNLADVPSIDDDSQEVIVNGAFVAEEEEVESDGDEEEEDDEDDDEDDDEERTTRLTSFDTEIEETEEEEEEEDLDFHTLEDQFEDEDDEGSLMYDDEYN